MWPLLLLAGCTPGGGVATTLVPTTTTTADAVVLLAKQEGGTVSVLGSVGGVDVAPQSVDIDAGGDERHGFRYQVRDAGGAVLYERTTAGPIIVRDFLDYYSDLTGLDVLSLLPGLGEFPVTVPLLDGATEVVFQFRTADGYDDVGRFPLSRLGEVEQPVPDSVVGSATLHEGGGSANRLDLVLVGDGYTADELDRWHADADALAAEILATEPYLSHQDRVNIHRVDAVSAESGVSYDCDPDCTLRDTAFGTVFAIEVVNRFTGSNYRTTPVFQLRQWEVAQAVSVVPWDAVIVVANTGHDGGMAVHYATVPNGPSDWLPTGVHELGHAFGLLGDEYNVDFCIRSDALGLPDNITDRGDDPPWGQWIEAGTPLPTPDEGAYNGVVGAYQGAYNCDDLYRSSRSCRMNSSGRGQFCPVCAEALVRRLFRYGDPLDGVTAVAGDAGEWTITADVPAGPVALTWSVDGEPAGTDSALTVTPAVGQQIAVEATWSTPYVRDDEGALTERWAWIAGEDE